MGFALVACGRNGSDRSQSGSTQAPAKNPTGPLVMLSARDAKLARSVRETLERAGMRVADAKALDDASRGPLFFGVIELAPPADAPPGVAARWKRDVETCRPAREKCPSVRSSPECEELMQCTHTLLMGLREAWLRELGVAASITVFAGATEQRPGVADLPGFYAKAWGHKPCETTLRELRVGAESSIMSIGSDAPLPNTAAETEKLAGELAVRIARGEGTTTPREVLAWMKQPTNDADFAKLLGCP